MRPHLDKASAEAWQAATAFAAVVRTIASERGLSAAEWIAVAVKAFDRVSILSDHRVRPRDAEGELMRS